MSGFAALMALSATQTQESQAVVQAKRAARERQKAEQRKQQEKFEEQERERQRKMREKHFQEQAREEERKKKREQEEKEREAERLRREEKARNTLRYGPKKAKEMNSSEGSATPKWPSTSSTAPQKRRSPATDVRSTEVLTREELRERKQLGELRRLTSGPKRTTTGHNGGGYRKAGGRLPGGAVDVIKPTGVPQMSASAPGSVRQRILEAPNQLIKLNTVKRDVRTVSEIIEDVHKARGSKPVVGTEAQTFDNWFSPSPREKRAGAAKPSPLGPAPAAAASVPRSTKSPAEATSTKSTAPAPALRPVKPLPKMSASRRPSPPSTRRPSPASANSKPSKAPTAINPAQKKRSRSPSYTDWPPKKRSRVEEEPSNKNLSKVIWGIFGRNKDQYVSKDVYSDDEDEMEVDADAVEREEKRSARIARKEDQEAQEAERLYELEKARRRKEKVRE